MEHAWTSTGVHGVSKEEDSGAIEVIQTLYKPQSP